MIVHAYGRSEWEGNVSSFCTRNVHNAYPKLSAMLEIEARHQLAALNLGRAKRACGRAITLPTSRERADRLVRVQDYR